MPRKPLTDLLPFTVGLLSPDERSVRLYHVEAEQPMRAYFVAVVEAGCEPLTLEEAFTEWPLLFVLEGHVPFRPVLTGSDISSD
ncbi:hypothetical protein [Methylorubrum populi]|uniref:hypothetical protein n=1 Tax=Methylorubrum populi TaxID=223967 RepID=UPI000DAFEE80|nr:hypothetical protein [Methylorubrum populi]PZP71803.1 MAG: hypothetical protein DI590_05950 [Methylorubrum populi]